MGRGRRRWLVRVFLGRDRQTRRRRYLNRTVHGPVRQAQTYLNKMLRERDLGPRNGGSHESHWTSSWIAGSKLPPNQNSATRAIESYESLLTALHPTMCSANEYCPQSPRSTCRTHIRK